MVSKIWSYFIIIGCLFGIINGKVNILNEEIIKSCKTSFDLICQIFPILTLWLGIANIAEKSGLLNIMSKKLLFKDIPKNHISLSYMASNIIANLFGLGSAATPFGLKAMESLQQLNNNKEVASKSMILFTTINTSGLTIVPATVIALRVMYESKSPTCIVLASIIATCMATISGVVLNKLIVRR
jgi:spore maturation protein A